MKPKCFAKRISSSPFIPSERVNQYQPKSTETIKLRSKLSWKDLCDFTQSFASTTEDNIQIVCADGESIFARRYKEIVEIV